MVATIKGQKITEEVCPLTCQLAISDITDSKLFGSECDDYWRSAPQISPKGGEEDFP